MTAAGIAPCFLLDTNVLSEPARKDPNARLMKRLRAHQTECVTAAPVWHELVFGVTRLRRSKRKRALERYLEQLLLATDVLPYDLHAATWHAQERARLIERGTPPSFTDGQIAAIAAVNGLTLVTTNVGHFSCFRELAMEDWTR